MTGDVSIPPLRNLPPGRLAQRTEHLVFEVTREPGSRGAFGLGRGRLVALAAVILVRGASRRAGAGYRRSPSRSDSGRTCAARGAESCVVARRPADRFREQARRQGAVRHERRRQRSEDRGARRFARQTCMVARRAAGRFRGVHFYVYVVNADGSYQRRLARRGAPAWSPDGRRIAFSATSFTS